MCSSCHLYIYTHTSTPVHLHNRETGNPGTPGLFWGYSGQRNSNTCHRCYSTNECTTINYFVFLTSHEDEIQTVLLHPPPWCSLPQPLVFFQRGNETVGPTRSVFRVKHELHTLLSEAVGVQVLAVWMGWGTQAFRSNLQTHLSNTEKERYTSLLPLRAQHTQQGLYHGYLAIADRT